MKVCLGTPEACATCDEKPEMNANFCVRALSRQREEKKMYRRGIDYPMYKDHVKMSMFMDEKEFKQWFTEKELEKLGYPNPHGYSGPLP